MRAAGVASDVITFNAAISACARGGQPGEALSLWEVLSTSTSGVRGESQFNAILDAVACWPLKARDLWILGLESGVHRSNQPYVLCQIGSSLIPRAERVRRARGAHAIYREPSACVKKYRAD